MQYDEQFLTSLDQPPTHYLEEVEKRSGCKIYIRGNQLDLDGENGSVQKAQKILEQLYKMWSQSGEIMLFDLSSGTDGKKIWKTHDGRVIMARNESQEKYLKALDTSTITFAHGPAGTGKTYIAIAHAVKSLMKDRSVNRIILTRPVVESGENLGFLPGTLEEKIDPYMRPLLDALYDCLEPEKVQEMLENKKIEISPLAYMRGRTFNHAYVVLDEAQNTKKEQMKMFLTRLGETSKLVITGDPNQSDLPNGSPNGLKDARDRLEAKNLQDVSFVTFARKDIVRHRLVQEIVEAYEEDEN